MFPTLFFITFVRTTPLERRQSVVVGVLVVDFGRDLTRGRAVLAGDSRTTIVLIPMCKFKIEIKN